MEGGVLASKSSEKAYGINEEYPQASRKKGRLVYARRSHPLTHS